MKSNSKLSINVPLVKFLTQVIFSLTLIFFTSIQLFAQEATGGDEVYEIEIDGKTYRVHVFKTVGSHQFIVSRELNADILIVAGGGGGGINVNAQHAGAGGGGAGGIIFLNNSLIQVNNYDLKVGKGGITASKGENGDNSEFGNHIAIGGGGGGYRYVAGGEGGSGGGNTWPIYTVSYGTPGQGHNGGIPGGGNADGGGGGGAGSIGKNSNIDGNNGGPGGDGLYFGDLFGSDVGVSGWFGGGGGGGNYSGGTNVGIGVHGGGSGGMAYSNGQNGIANTGGGGGGAGAGGRGGDGGSGIVIVRYEINQFNLNINNENVDITPTKSSPNFALSGTIDYPDDGDATSVTVSASIGGISRSLNVPVSTNMTWQLSWSYNELSEGEYTDIEFTATSNSFTPEETTSTYTGKIIIDKTAPTCGSWSPSESPWKVSGGEYFTLTSSSDTGGSGIDIGGGVCNTGPNHGDQCVLEIKDKAGNTTLCSSPVNNIDIFPPQLQVTPPIPGWQGNKQNIIIEPSDDKTGIKRTAYSWLVNNLGSDCTGGDTYNPGDDLRLTIMGGENTLYTCTVDNAGNTTFTSKVYRYIPPILTTPKLQKNVKPSNLYWNIQSVSETQSYIEVKGFFPKTTGTYNYSLEYIVPTINKSYTQALRTSPFTETHFTFLIPTTDFKASKDNHTFSGPQKLKITDLDQMEATTIDHNLSFFFPIHQTNHRTSFNYFIFASDNRVNEVGEP